MTTLSLLDCLLWILISFGITISITHGKIFNTFRLWTAQKSTFFGDLFRCPMCLGFWVGMFLNLSGQGVTSNPILDGFLSLTTCFSIYSVLWAIALKDV